MDRKVAEDKRILQLSKLDEFRNEAYENAWIYKKNMKACHEKHIVRKAWNEQQVLLFNSRLKLFPGKLKSKWSGPFTVTQVFPYGGGSNNTSREGTVQTQCPKC